MSSPKIDPAVKRAITILENRGFTGTLTAPGSKRVAALVVPGPVVEAAPRTFKTKAELKAGDGFPCLVDSDCKRLTRTLGRSKVHATPATLQAEGHLPQV